MNCETVEALLLDYIEGELDTEQSQQVRAHLEGCPDCRTNVEETRALIDAMEVARQGQEKATQQFTHGHSATTSQPHDAVTFTWRPGQVLGDFEILGEIGRGGMGIVYRARQVSLNRVVALKVLPHSVCQTEKAVTRFKKEAKAAAKLHHTNIVGVYAQSEHEGHFYYAMELIEGEGLDQVLKQSPRMVAPKTLAASTVEDEAEESKGTGSGAFLLASRSILRADYRTTALLMAGVAEGLEHAHKNGVIHRDIKPQNLLLGADGHLHITDFGLARLFDEPSVTVTGEMLGTPAYMSPEQVAADRRKIDHRTDIYSLGVTFYELLTGHRPFDGASRERIIARICTDEPRPPRKWNQAIPIDLETICLRAMEKDPRRRYQSAKDMASDLRRYAEDRPILSRRVSSVEKAIKWVRRHPALTAIIALSVALVITVTVWTVQSIHARHARARELVRRAFDSLAYVDYREPEEAFACLAQAKPIGPNDDDFRIDYLRTLGLAQLLTDPDAAVATLNGAIELAPENTELMYLLAWALRRNEQTEDSLEWIARADDLSGGDTTAAGHFFHAQAVVRHSPEKAEIAYGEAISNRDRYIQAMVHLARADNHWMYHHRDNERFSRQEAYLLAACEFQRGKAYPRYLLSIAYRLSAEIYEASGNIERAKERYEAALAVAKQAQQAEPGSSRGYACEAEYWESRGDPTVALAAWDQGAKCCVSLGERVELYQYRWRLNYWLGQYPRAMDDLVSLAEICPESDGRRMWYQWLFPAMIRADEGDLKGAARCAYEMAEADPTSFRAVTSAASLLKLLGRPDEARALCAKHAEGLDYRIDTVATFPPGWVESLFAYCQGTKSLADLDSLAGTERADTLLWPAAYFFAGAQALGAGDRETALTWFKRCEATYDYDDYCYLAKVFVRKLEGNPKWPAWVSTQAGRAESP